jgi:hypothetical protein
VKHKKSFRDGELIRRCAIKMANDLVTAKSLKISQLSRCLIRLLAEELVKWLTMFLTLRCVMNDCEFYSLSLDESTDITDVCQVMILVRKIDKNFGIKEEFLKLQPLTTGTKGSDIFEALNKVVSELTSFEKCTGIVTDGAKSVVGSKTGLMGHLKQ